MRGRAGFARLGKAAGSAIGKISIVTFVCRGCGLQHQLQSAPGHKAQKPVQCKSCGRMDFDRFDTRGEANRWAELLLREKAGIIADLNRQVRFDLMAWDAARGLAVKVGQYVADYTYRRVEENRRVIEDHKGNAMTELAAWKLRHMAAQGMPVEIHQAKG